MHVTRKEWYRRVNAAWPATVPPLTPEEAVRAFRRLYRYAFKRTYTGYVRVATGNRRTGREYQWATGTRGWRVNPSHGWKDLVHILSHYASPGVHGGKHARMELRLIRQVLQRGWLDGKLRPVVPPIPPAMPTAADKRVVRMQRLLQREARWAAKLKRAERALRKLRRQRRYYEREQAKAA
jgi:hypothetical protein